MDEEFTVVQCPISCGSCCDYWRDIFPDYSEDVNDCPNLTPKGCRFQLKNRPDSCGWYLCDLGVAVFEGKIDIKQAEVICENGLQQFPTMWKDVLWEGFENGKQ